MDEQRRPTGATPTSYTPLAENFRFVSDTDPDFHLPAPKERKKGRASALLRHLAGRLAGQDRRARRSRKA